HGKEAQGSPDGRFWFTQAANVTDPVQVRAVALPDDAARRVSAQLAEGKVRIRLKPGTKISLEQDFTGLPEAEYRRRFEESIRTTLISRGLILAPGQPIKLRLRAEESDTGEKLKAEVVTAGKTETVEIARKRLTCHATLTDAEGKALMPAKREVFE